MNSIDKVFALFLALLLLFAWPIYESFQKQDDISSLVVLNAVSKFVDSARNKGYVSPAMYNDFVQEMQRTGNTFDVELEHHKKIIVPHYTNPLQPASFTGDISVEYDKFYNQQIMERLFPDSNEPITSTNRIYPMHIGDFFQVTVKNTNRTHATVILDFLTASRSPETRIVVPYGGMVLNEDY